MEYGVKVAEDYAPDAEDDKVPKETDGDVEVVSCDNRKGAKNCGGYEGQAAIKDSRDLKSIRQL